MGLVRKLEKGDTIEWQGRGQMKTEDVLRALASLDTEGLSLKEKYYYLQLYNAFASGNAKILANGNILLTDIALDNTHLDEEGKFIKPDNTGYGYTEKRTGLDIENSGIFTSKGTAKQRDLDKALANAFKSVKLALSPLYTNEEIEKIKSAQAGNDAQQESGHAEAEEDLEDESQEILSPYNGGEYLTQLKSKLFGGEYNDDYYKALTIPERLKFYLSLVNLALQEADTYYPTQDWSNTLFTTKDLYTQALLKAKESLTEEKISDTDWELLLNLGWGYLKNDFNTQVLNLENPQNELEILSKQILQVKNVPKEVADALAKNYLEEVRIYNESTLYKALLSQYERDYEYWYNDYTNINPTNGSWRYNDSSNSVFQLDLDKCVRELDKATDQATALSLINELNTKVLNKSLFNKGNLLKFLQNPNSTEAAEWLAKTMAIIRYATSQEEQSKTLLNFILKHLKQTKGYYYIDFGDIIGSQATASKLGYIPGFNLNNNTITMIRESELYNDMERFRDRYVPDPLKGRSSKPTRPAIVIEKAPVNPIQRVSPPIGLPTLKKGGIIKKYGDGNVLDNTSSDFAADSISFMKDMNLENKLTKVKLDQAKAAAHPNMDPKYFVHTGGWGEEGEWSEDFTGPELMRLIGLVGDGVSVFGGYAAFGGLASDVLNFAADVQEEGASSWTPWVNLGTNLAFTAGSIAPSAGSLKAAEKLVTLSKSTKLLGKVLKWASLGVAGADVPIMLSSWKNIMDGNFSSGDIENALRSILYSIQGYRKFRGKPMNVKLRRTDKMFEGAEVVPKQTLKTSNPFTSPEITEELLKTLQKMKEAGKSYDEINAAFQQMFNTKRNLPYTRTGDKGKLFEKDSRPKVPTLETQNKSVFTGEYTVMKGDTPRGGRLNPILTWGLNLTSPNIPNYLDEWITPGSEKYYEERELKKKKETLQTTKKKRTTRAKRHMKGGSLEFAEVAMLKLGDYFRKPEKKSVIIYTDAEGEQHYLKREDVFNTDGSYNSQFLKKFNIQNPNDIKDKVKEAKLSDRKLLKILLYNEDSREYKLLNGKDLKSKDTSTRVYTKWADKSKDDLKNIFYDNDGKIKGNSEVNLDLSLKEYDWTKFYNTDSNKSYAVKDKDYYDGENAISFITSGEHWHSLAGDVSSLLNDVNFLKFFEDNFGIKKGDGNIKYTLVDNFDETKLSEEAKQWLQTTEKHSNNPRYFDANGNLVEGWRNILGKAIYDGINGPNHFYAKLKTTNHYLRGDDGNLTLIGAEDAKNYTHIFTNTLENGNIDMFYNADDEYTPSDIYYDGTGLYKLDEDGNKVRGRIEDGKFISIVGDGGSNGKKTSLNNLNNILGIASGALTLAGNTEALEALNYKYPIPTLRNNSTRVFSNIDTNTREAIALGYSLASKMNNNSADSTLNRNTSISATLQNLQAGILQDLANNQSIQAQELHNQDSSNLTEQLNNLLKYQGDLVAAEMENLKGRDKYDYIQAQTKVVTDYIDSIRAQWLQNSDSRKQMSYLLAILGMDRARRLYQNKNISDTKYLLEIDKYTKLIEDLFSSWNPYRVYYKKGGSLNKVLALLSRQLHKSLLQEAREFYKNIRRKK